MTVNYLMVSSDDGSITSWLLVMTVNYLMVSSDGGHVALTVTMAVMTVNSRLLVMTVNYVSDGGQLPHGF